MTFRATVQTDVLEAALAPVQALVSECKLQVDADGIAIRAVDPANVAMVDMEVDASAFASYSATEETLGVNLDRFSDVLSMADSDEMVSLYLDGDTRRLEVSFGGLDYQQALIDPESIRAEPDIPDLDLPGTYVMAGSDLDRGVRAADLVSDHLELKGQPEQLLLIAEGDTDDVELTLNEELQYTRGEEIDESIVSLFSLEYLQDMLKPIGSTTELSLLVGQEMPVKLRYSLQDDVVSVVNMLAPRISSE
jgi:proliferating cell nuclear antigen